MVGDTLTYTQGQTATITADFVTSAGTPVDVPDAKIQIFGDASEIILPATPMAGIITGFYFCDYSIPKTLPAKIYTVVVSGTVEGVSNQMSMLLQVKPAAVPVPIESR